MKYWIQHDADCPMAIRSAGDPFDDLDAVVEYWNAVSLKWISDPNLALDMVWDPHIRDASKADVQKLISASAAA
ncbi:hypothetical protein LV457_09515 [Mycobacterium sp. MYCO198283]|uniref:hypothetical protein n=1 Tax=Mycobacterium sp. MYCO198283 TaxID=2883505 RepID=UPI001E4FEBE4|nr:hypothetical protein [Mycobacterium sp. MYCO198283]MCG5432528.1 hypothetical protein [Mycobacterium sp. MYCO198283]